MPTLLEYYMIQTGKSQDEITPQEYEALRIAMKYQIEEIELSLKK